jgi:hypothetical protein
MIIRRFQRESGICRRDVKIHCSLKTRYNYPSLVASEGEPASISVEKGQNYWMGRPPVDIGGSGEELRWRVGVLYVSSLECAYIPDLPSDEPAATLTRVPPTTWYSIRSNLI